MRDQLSRRQWLKLAALGAAGAAQASWFEALADQAAPLTRGRKACILLWMNGGPSQLDTFDPKPNHANGGPVRPLDTNVPGLRISEYLPRLSRHADQLAILRTMSTREGDHVRATYYLRTGYLPIGGLQHPTLGSLLSKELGDAQAALPNFVSIAPYRQLNPAAYGPGFLGPQHAPLLVGDNVGFAQQPNQPAAYETALRVQDLQPGDDVIAAQVEARLGFLERMQRDFARDHPDLPAQSHVAAYDRAVRLMRTTARTAFNLDEEPASIRDAYGRNLFGQGCLLARRLIERGVPFIEVTHGGLGGNSLGWDTHNNNFAAVRGLCDVLDPAWATLMQDLKQRGLLESTLIVWMGEFGRTPRINPQGGRDHFPSAWSAVLAGGLVRGGQAFGKTTEDGMEPVGTRSVSVPDLIATMCRALGLDPNKQNMSGIGRPIRLADPSATPVTEVLA
jgi:hypothetical protein